MGPYPMCFQVACNVCLLYKISGTEVVLVTFVSGANVYVRNQVVVLAKSFAQ